MVQLSRLEATGVGIQQAAPTSGQGQLPVSTQNQTTPPASTSANANMQVISETQKKNKLGNQPPKKAKLTPPPPALNAGWDDADDDNDLGGMDDQGVIRD